MKYFKNINRNRIDLLWQLIKTNFQMRYYNSVLGILWVLIKPYSTFIVQYVVWSHFAGSNIPKYALYLLMGVIIYTYFNELIVFGQLGLLDKAHIILKVNFPRQIAIVSSLSNALVNLMINMFFVFIIAALSGDDVSIQGIVYIIFLAILVFVFALGVSFFLSIITVRFRDFKNIIELGLFLLYWATPVFYVVDHSLTGKVADVVKANPLGIVINQFRAALDVYAQPDYKLMIVYFIACLLLCIAGWFYFQSHVKKIAEYF